MTPVKKARIALLALLAVALGVSLALDPGDTKAKLDRALSEANLHSMLARRAAFYAKYAAAYDEDGYSRLTPPVAGEWLASYAEGGQTFREYKGVALRATPERPEMVLQPYAPMDERGEALQETVRAFNERFFGLPTRLAKPLELPPEAYNESRRQYLGDTLLDFLEATRPKDALVHAGICDRDLYSRSTTNYVFGVGTLSGGVGVYSFHRFGGPHVPDDQYLRRCVKLLSHEIGHSLGLKHCIYYRCGMNGCISLAEMDAAPVHYCPVCLRKLAEAMGFEVLSRYRALAEIYAKSGLKPEAEWVRARILYLEGAGKAAPWSSEEGRTMLPSQPEGERR